MKILAVSDITVNRLYTPEVRSRFQHADLLISCGDLPYHYLDYLVTMLNRPLYLVRGNHAMRDENNATSPNLGGGPLGAIDLHRRVTRDASGLLLAGIEGCLRYNNAPYQYSQEEMWGLVLGLFPALLINRVRYGRWLDIFVTHAPPWHIHDDIDLPHQGIRAFRWFIQTFCPTYHLHGHIHLYHPQAITTTRYHQTCVVNVFGYQEIDITPLAKKT